MAIKLVTGLNGTYKTSTELWDFLNNPAYEGRAKYATSIKGFDPARHGVGHLDDLKGWRDLPEGSVIFVDEAQNYLGPRGTRGEPPEWMNKLAEHRHGGYDFILTTPNPMMIDSFVRYLCKPHVHYVRPFNIGKYSRWAFEECQTQPTTNSAKAKGVRTIGTTDKRVFDLYTSTVLDTHTQRFPRKLVYVIVGGIFLVGFGAWRVYEFFPHDVDQVKKTMTATGQGVAGAGAPAGMARSGYSKTVVPDADRREDHATWDAKGITPRIQGMPWTAPIYDDLTKPVDFPRIAACIESPTHPCQCYTQQATPLGGIPMATCKDIVKHGYFDPWINSNNSQLTQGADGSQHWNVPAGQPQQDQRLAMADSQAQQRPVSIDTGSVSYTQDPSYTNQLPQAPRPHLRPGPRAEPLVTPQTPATPQPDAH